MALAEGERDGDPARIRRSLEASLRRLGTEYVDHYQLHRPDPNTPQEDTLGALEELRAEGKIREIGCTYFSADELADAERAGAAIGVPSYPSVQNQYSLLTRAPETDGVLDVCGRSGIAFVPFFPLESGLLTGKYRLGEAAADGHPAGGVGRAGVELHRRRPAADGRRAHDVRRVARAVDARAGDRAGWCRIRW